MSARGFAATGKAPVAPFVVSACDYGEDFHDVERYETFDDAHAAAKDLLRTVPFARISRGARILARYQRGEDVA